MKIGMVIWLMLGVMFVSELVVLSDQLTDQTTNTQVEQDQNESTGPATDQTTNTQAKSDRNSVDEKNNVQPDTTKENTSTAGGINYLNICIGLGGIGGFLYGLAAFLKFIWKARSKVNLPYSAEDLDKQDITEDLEKLDEKIEQNPKSSLIEKATTDAYRLQQNQRIEEALEKWRSIANIAEGHDNDLTARALFSVGYLLTEGDKALSAYDKVINLNPNSVPTYNNRAAVKSNLGKYEEALTDYNQAIRLKPDFAEAYTNRGNTKVDLGKYEDAIIDHSEAIRLKPDFAEAYSNRGIAKRRLNKYEGAITDYSEALRLKPSLAEAYYNRGSAKEVLGQHEDALADYDDAIRLKPDLPAAYYKQGNVKFHLCQYESALINFDSAIRLKADYAEAYCHRAAAKTMLG